MTFVTRLAAVRPIASAVLAFGMLSAPVVTTAALAQTLSEERTQDLIARRLDAAEVNPSSQVYLFGDTPARDQIGSRYMVVEVQDEAVVGAIYMPHSSFDCFQGTVEGDRLNLSITNSYNLTTYAYSMDLQTDGVVASTTPTTVPAEPAGYHLISAVNNNDLRLLETCKADFQS